MGAYVGAFSSADFLGAVWTSIADVTETMSLEAITMTIAVVQIPGAGQVAW